PPHRNASDAFDITRNRGGAGQRSKNCTRRIGQQSAPVARYLSILDESALLAHTNQCAHVIEEIYKQKGKQNFEEAEMDGAAKIKLQECRRRMRQGNDR